jgi:hypothetical protein
LKLTYCWPFSAGIILSTEIRMKDVIGVAMFLEVLLQLKLSFA